jgi:hypothetical protein
MKRMLEDEKFEIAELGFRNIFSKVVWFLTIRARAGLLNHSITKVKLLNNLIKVLKVSYLSSGQSRNCILQLFLVF